jgi:hypothetical protein
MHTILEFSRVRQPTTAQDFFPIPKDAQFQPLDLASSKPGEFELELQLGTLPSETAILSIPVATYNETVKISSAVLLDSTGKELAKAEEDFRQEDNAFIRFEIDSSLKVDQWPSQVHLKIKSKKARLAIWGKKTEPTENNADKTFIFVNPQDQATFAVNGKNLILHSPENLSPFQLLNFMWSWDLNAVTGYSFVHLAVFFLLVFSIRSFTLNRFMLRSILASVFFGLSIFYCYVFPPLQAPDEPDHILSYARITESTELANTLLKFAQNEHFERLKFNGEEKFSKKDMAASFDQPFAGHISDSIMEERSVPTVDFWKILGPVVKKINGAGKQIFVMRALNVLALTFSFALSLIWIAFRKPEKSAALSLIWGTLLLYSPILLFFGLHVSNYFLTVAFGILCCTFTLKKFSGADGIRSLHYAGLGFAIMGMQFSSSAGLTMLGFWFPFLFLFSKVNEKNTLIHSAMKSAYLALGLTFGLLIMARGNISTTFGSLSNFLDILINPGLWKSNKIMLAIVSCATLPIVCFSGLPLELMQKQFFKKTLSGFHLLLVMTFLAALIAPLFLHSRQLLDIEVDAGAISAFQYMKEVLKVMFMNFGFGSVDFYLSSSYWGGMGWLESDFDNTFVIFLRTLATLGIGFQLLSVQRSGSVRDQLFNIAMVSGLIGLLIGSSIALGNQRINYHGRYMIPFYLPYLAWSSIGYVTAYKYFERKVPSYILQALPVALLLFTHSYAISFILRRYFG